MTTKTFNFYFIEQNESNEKVSLLSACTLGKKLFSGKIMPSYSEAAIEPSPYKTIILYFVTTMYRSYFLVKLQIWIIYVDAWCCFDDNATSVLLHIDFVSTLKRLCLSKGMQLYKTINSVKTIFQEIWAMVQSSYHVENGFGEHSFRILHFIYNAYQRLLLVDTKNVR